MDNNVPEIERTNAKTWIIMYLKTRELMLTCKPWVKIWVTMYLKRTLRILHFYILLRSFSKREIKWIWGIIVYVDIQFIILYHVSCKCKIYQLHQLVCVRNKRATETVTCHSCKLTETYSDWTQLLTLYPLTRPFIDSLLSGTGSQITITLVPLYCSGFPAIGTTLGTWKKEIFLND